MSGFMNDSKRHQTAPHCMKTGIECNEGGHQALFVLSGWIECPMPRKKAVVFGRRVREHRRSGQASRPTAEITPD